MHYAHQCRDTAIGRRCRRQCLLGKFLTGSIRRHRQVCITGLRIAEALLQPELARGRVNEVGASYDIGHAGLGIVDHDGQLVGIESVRAQQHEITDLAFQILGNAPLHPVIKVKRRIADPDSPGPRTAPSRQAIAAGSGIDTTAIDGCQNGRISDFPTRAGTSVDHPLRAQGFQHIAVGLLTPRLPDQFPIPFKTEASERPQDIVGRPRHIARRIDILDTQ